MPQLTPYQITQMATLEWQLCKEKADEALCVVPEEAGPFVDAALLHCTRIGLLLVHADKEGWELARRHIETLHWATARIVAAL